MNFDACWLEFCTDTSAENEHGNGKSRFLIGDTSSNGWFSIVMLVFGEMWMILQFRMAGWLSGFNVLGWGGHCKKPSGDKTPAMNLGTF